MRTLRQVDIKNCPGYFFNSMTNIIDLDTNLLGTNQISFTSTDIVVYVFNDVDTYFEWIYEKKYLVFALTDKNKKALENYRELWDEIKEEIRTIRGIEPFKFEKDVIKIRFESDYGLPLGKILNILVCVVIVRSVFGKNGKYYPQVHLKDFFFEYEHENEDDSYVAFCERFFNPRLTNCVDYGLFLPKKCV